MSAAEAVPERDAAGRSPRLAGTPAYASSPLAEAVEDSAGVSRARARLSSHLAWNFGADLAARGASLWLAFFCARVLGVAGFGRFSFALAAAQYAWILGDAVLNNGYATRETARDHGATAGQAGLFWSARLLAALGLTALYLTVTLLVPGESATRRTLAAAAIYFLAYAAFPDWALRGLGDFRGLALGNLVYAVSLIVATLVLLPAHPDSALAVSLWGGGFALAGLVTLARLARRSALRLRPSFSFVAWRPHFRRSSMFSLGSVAAIGYTQLPIVLAGVLTGPHEVGLFSAGFRLLLAFIGTLTILWWPLMPLLTREQPRSAVFREVLGSSASLVLAVSVPVALAFTLFPAEVLTWLFGRAYAAGAPSLAIGAWVLPLYALTGLLEQTSLALGGERLRAGVAWTTFGVMGGLAFLFVPRWGAVGAAMTSVAGFALALTFYAARLRRLIQLGDVFRPLMRVGAVSGALALFWLTAPRLTSLPVWVWLGVGAALYVPLALGAGLLRLAPRHTWPRGSR